MKRKTATDPFDRGALLALSLERGEVVTSRLIKERFGVSWATAKRDLVRLQCVLPVQTDVVEMSRWKRHELRLTQ